jgi:antitoxin VapB
LTDLHIQFGICKRPTPSRKSEALPVPVPPSRPREAKLFRNNRSRAVRILVEFELPGDRVLIHRDGNKLIIEPVSRPANIFELLAEWRSEGPLAQEDQLPKIEDNPANPEEIF